MSIDMNHTRHAPGQAVKPCPQCGGALVDTSDQIWAHAIGIEPCGWKQPARVPLRLEAHQYYPDLPCWCGGMPAFGVPHQMGGDGS